MTEIIPSNIESLKTRKATKQDIPFLTKIEYEASLPPTNYCFWDDILQGINTDSLQFIAAILKTDASNWGNVPDFMIIEENGQPVGAASGFIPNLEDYRPLRLSNLDAIAALLGWSEQTTSEFYHNYEKFWGNDRQPAFLKPQASWLIESVAILPSARGRGLGKFLLAAMVSEAKSQQYPDVGIMVINGNDRARQTYESIGFQPYLCFYPEYFNAEFSGVTKFRLRFN